MKLQLTLLWTAFKEVWPFMFKLWAMLLASYISIKLFSGEVLDKVQNIDFVAIILAVIGILATILKTQSQKKQIEKHVCKSDKH